MKRPSGTPVPSSCLRYSHQPPAPPPGSHGTPLIDFIQMVSKNYSGFTSRFCLHTKDLVSNTVHWWYLHTCLCKISVALFLTVFSKCIFCNKDRTTDYCMWAIICKNSINGANLNWNWSFFFLLFWIFCFLKMLLASDILVLLSPIWNGIALERTRKLETIVWKA